MTKEETIKNSLYEKIHHIKIHYMKEEVYLFSIHCNSRHQNLEE